MTMALGGMKNFAALVAIRFMQAAFEAGLLPGIIYCLTFWYKQDERGLRAAFIGGCATLGKISNYGEIPLICEHLPQRVPSAGQLLSALGTWTAYAACKGGAGYLSSKEPLPVYAQFRSISSIPTFPRPAGGFQRRNAPLPRSESKASRHLATTS